EFLQLAYQIAIHGRDELPLAPDEYTGFSMTLLRLHAFRPLQPPALGGLPDGDRGGAGRADALPAAPRPSSPSRRPEPAGLPPSTAAAALRGGGALTEVSAAPVAAPQVAAADEPASPTPAASAAPSRAP